MCSRVGALLTSAAQAIYTTTPDDIMSAQLSEGKVKTDKGAPQQRKEDFACLGYLHQHALRNPSYEGVEKMHRELDRLHAHALQTLGPTLGMAGSPAPPAIGTSPQTHHNGQPNNTLTTPGWEKPAMKRWHAETASDQAWNGL